MSWTFDCAKSSDIDELMTWFPDAHSVDIWGGPKFRYPFTRKSFRKDCRWNEFSSYCLHSPNGEFAAFGQLGSRYERSHLARLITHPDMRSQGIAKKLIARLLEAIEREHGSAECGLFVYRNNEPAYRCYLSLGFEVHEYPEGAPMREQCFYLTKKLL